MSCVDSYLKSLFGLQGKVAVVTGANRGLGRVYALALARAGAMVALLGRTRPSYLEDGEDFEAFGEKLLFVQADVTREEEVARAMRTVYQELGHIDVLCNNAGVCAHQAALSMDKAAFTRELDTNLTGTFLTCKAAAEYMRRQADGGIIINIASISAHIVNLPQWQCSYNASKAAVAHLTKSLAVEWAPLGIRVNCISPGYFPVSDQLEPKIIEQWKAMVPLARMGKPEELVPTLLYLASGASGYTTGCDVLVDGGYTCV